MKKIGGGGMGDVYLARHHRFKDRQYAIKVLKRNMLSEHARFEKEVFVSGQLDHPNIVFAQDAGKEAGEPYLVMETSNLGSAGRFRLNAFRIPRAAGHRKLRFIPHRRAVWNLANTADGLSDPTFPAGGSKLNPNAFHYGRQYS